MALPVPTPSPDELRRAIIARLGIDPKKLTAFGGSPEFDANITNLYRTATKRLADLDINQQRIGSDYEQNLALARQGQTRNLRSMEGSLADRGLLSSGQAVTQRSRMGEEFANRLQALNQARTRGIQDVGSQRNEAINTLLSGRASYEGDYANNLSTFLQQQAQAAAALAIQKPVAPVVAPAAVKRRVSSAPIVAPLAPVAPIARPTTQRAVSTPFGVGYRPKKGGRVAI